MAEHHKSTQLPSRFLICRALQTSCIEEANITSWVSSNRVPRVSRISRVNIDSSRARASSDESFGSKRPSKKVSTLEERQFDRFFFLLGNDEVFKQLSLYCALLGRLECEHSLMEVWLYLANLCLETRWRWYYHVNQSA